MNSKFSAQFLYSSFVLLLIIVDSLQSPITEDKRAAHKLIRFGRNPSHQLIHFGKRNAGKLGIDSNEDEMANLTPNEVSNEAVDQNSKNDLVRLLLAEINKNNDYSDSPGYMSMVERRSENRPFASLAFPRKYYLKKADRDNVFMHFG